MNHRYCYLLQPCMDECTKLNVPAEFLCEPWKMSFSVTGWESIVD